MEQNYYQIRVEVRQFNERMDGVPNAGPRGSVLNININPDLNEPNENNLKPDNNG
jgi:hypothetical protein